MRFWKLRRNVMKMKWFFTPGFILGMVLSVWLFLCPAAEALPTYEQVRAGFQASDLMLLDRFGAVLHEMRIDPSVRRLSWANLSDISPALRQAVVWAEDRRFFSHHGVDYSALGAAAISSLFSGNLRGASTISMQLASFLDRDLQAVKGRRSLRQKWLQIQAARNIERVWSKDEILEAYLNLIYYSGEFQGVSAASRGLFGKYPHGLDEAESLVLAALIRAPNAPEAEVTQRAEQLNQAMGRQIPDERIREKITQALLGPRSVRGLANSAPHVARRLLKSRKDAAVACTLDAELQRFSEERLAHHLIPLKTSNVGEGAILVVENLTGDVLAYASHTSDPARSRFVDGVIAKRQAGSTLKPFLYGAAFERRILTPATLLDDSPLDLAVPGGIYQPSNYDHAHRGQVTVRVALASSLNIPAVRAGEMLGVEAFIQTLRDLGIDKLNESGAFYGPSLALGSADVSLWEIVSAYRTLANGGNRSRLHLRDPEGNREADPQRVFSNETAFLISDILSDRQARSLTFGLENVLATRFWTAVKTGTSKDMRDNWCMGYSRQYTVGVWVGNFSGEPMWNVSGLTGAAPLWLEIMNRLHPQTDKTPVSPPDGVIRCRVQLFSDRVSERAEWFIRGTEPVEAPIKAVNFLPHIVYPPSGAVFAVDSDIPKNQQRIFFTAHGRMNGLRWVVDGQPFRAAAGPAAWNPASGHHILELCDAGGVILDSVRFQVRGGSNGLGE
ncbi:MAG: penicillin-binding protein 1C [Deltaproteobacteria bacterium]|nr:penicillin-binding protein 1C [Deltaproteobacteria bacterium]